MKKIVYIIALFATWSSVILFTACTDDTAFIGSTIMPDNDEVTTSYAVYPVRSRSVQVDSVLANTKNCYLGSIVDPETHAKTTCGFLAQFHMMENYHFPDKSKMICDENGKVVVDSCAIRIFFDEYMGDSLAVMKLIVQELDTTKVMEENLHYYTNIDPQNYLNNDPAKRYSYSYTVKDLSRENATNPSIVLRLPTEYGSHIVNKYYENPNFFKNSYEFIHHVCPGLYFKTENSVGSMIKTFTTTLDVYFKYNSKDSIVDGMHRMAATEEVLQNTKVENRIPAEMLYPENPYTYLKSPNGIFTELELPIEEIVADEHYTDTINSAQLMLRKYNAKDGVNQLLKNPESIVMLRKADMFTFFEDSKLPDNKTSYIADYNTAYNAYVFNNIANLLTYIKLERDKLAGVEPGDDEATRLQKYEKWENAKDANGNLINAEWNKVVIIPVDAEYNTSSDLMGNSSKTLLRVKNQMGLRSAKIEGGANSTLKLNVIYSRFKYNK
jgi:hypothetical protein